MTHDGGVAGEGGVGGVGRVGERDDITDHTLTDKTTNTIPMGNYHPWR